MVKAKKSEKKIYYVGAEEKKTKKRAKKWNKSGDKWKASPKETERSEFSRELW